VAGSQLLLALPLPGHQPVHRGVDLVGAGIGHAQVGAQRGVAAGPPRRGQLRFRRRTARDRHQRVGDVAFGARWPQQRGQAQLGCHHVRRGHVPVRYRPLHLDRRLGVDQGAALQRRPQRLDRLRRQVRIARVSFPARRGRSGAAGMSGRPGAPRPPWRGSDQPGPRASCRRVFSQQDSTTGTTGVHFFSGYVRGFRRTGGVPRAFRLSPALRYRLMVHA